MTCHYPDLGSASDWQKQFSSDVISQGSQWWHLEMSASKIKSIEFPWICIELFSRSWLPYIIFFNYESNASRKYILNIITAIINITISKHTFVGPVKCGLSQTFVVSPKNQLSPHLQVCGIRVVKHHVYVTRETRILYHVIKFPLYLSFTVNFSTPKSVVSCIFYP